MDVKNLSKAYLFLILEIFKALNVKIVTPFSHKTVPSFVINGNYLQGVTCQKTRNSPVLHKARKTAETDSPLVFMVSHLQHRSTDQLH